MSTLNYKDVLKLLTKSSYDWRITSNFGDGDGIRQNKHDGTDFGMDRNTPLYAPTNNTLVTWEQYGIQEKQHKQGTLQEFGNTILIYVPEWNRTYALCHLQYKGIYVDMGKSYPLGTKLALSGNTGLSSGPHLHIGVCVGKATTLTDLRKRAINFVKDVIKIDSDLKSNEEVAKEVLNGDWGNGQERKDKLTAAGYDYNAIQSIVNGEAVDTKPTPSKPKGKVGQVLVVYPDDYSGDKFYAYPTEQDAKKGTNAYMPWTLNKKLYFKILEDKDPCFKCGQYGDTVMKGVNFVWIKWAPGIGFKD